MTPEAQRIAIAEACGYTIDYWPDGSGRFSTVKDNTYVGLPDYPADLNAMHEAEGVGLTSEKLCAEFATKLAIVVKGFPHDPHLGPQSYIWHATAAQRAEAFLRTLGLWEEGA